MEKNNANASGNFIEHGSEQYVVRGLGLVKDTKDIENIIVATHEHAPVYVRDVADVQIGAELRQGAVTANGKPLTASREGIYAIFNITEDQKITVTFAQKGIVTAEDRALVRQKLDELLESEEMQV